MFDRKKYGAELNTYAFGVRINSEKLEVGKPIVFKGVGNRVPGYESVISIELCTPGIMVAEVENGTLESIGLGNMTKGVLPGDRMERIEIPVNRAIVKRIKFNPPRYRE